MGRKRINSRLRSAVLKSQQQQKKSLFTESSYHCQDTSVMSKKQEGLGLQSKICSFYTAPATMGVLSLSAAATQSGGAGEGELTVPAAWFLEIAQCSTTPACYCCKEGWKPQLRLEWQVLGMESWTQKKKLSRSCHKENCQIMAQVFHNGESSQPKIKQITLDFTRDWISQILLNCLKTGNAAVLDHNPYINGLSYSDLTTENDQWLNCWFSLLV